VAFTPFIESIHIIINHSGGIWPPIHWCTKREGATSSSGGRQTNQVHFLWRTVTKQPRPYFIKQDPLIHLPSTGFEILQTSIKPTIFRLHA